MKTTLYWDDNYKYVWYKTNGKGWRRFDGKKWKYSTFGHWTGEEFNRSLTVNNFQEK